MKQVNWDGKDGRCMLAVVRLSSEVAALKGLVLEDRSPIEAAMLTRLLGERRANLAVAVTLLRKLRAVPARDR